MLSVREMQISDIPFFMQYWYSADHAYLHGMGVDVNKMPAPEKFSSLQGVNVLNGLDINRMMVENSAGILATVE
jgi:hypothetical protein